MKKIFYGLFLLAPVVANAEVLDLDVALRATYTACVGIDDELADLKKMAGINTAVTAVGTGLGIGATTVGIVKASKDAQAETAAKTIKNNVIYTEENIKKFLAPSEEEMEAFLADFKKQQWDDNVKPLRDDSKKLGNWRTGLMAGNTATNIAGAIIAGNNKVDADLETQIKDCRAAVKNLRDSVVRARIEGQDVTEANEIVSACAEYDYVDVSKINDRAKGAMISSIVGATTGVAGTATSAYANSDKIRNEGEYDKKLDRTDTEWQKEKNWNTAANVLAGTSTVASGVATVFNATQISAIKKVANVAEKCTGVLK